MYPALCLMHNVAQFMSDVVWQYCFSWGWLMEYLYRIIYFGLDALTHWLYLKNFGINKLILCYYFSLRCGPMVRRTSLPFLH